MQERIYKSIDEKVYTHTLSNGIEVFLYPNDKTKNFYITINVGYGARVMKYKLRNKIYEVLPGSAHFLEHKIMDYVAQSKIFDKFEELGSVSNAWTSYFGTNYNIYGSENVLKNLEMLLYVFHNPKINDNSVESEKGIINEEIASSKDEIYTEMIERLFVNMTFNSYEKTTITGEVEDITKFNAKYLLRIYKHFYIPSNTFIIVSGNINPGEILDFLEKYYKKLKLSKADKPKMIVSKEPNKTKVDSEIINKDVTVERVYIGYKMPFSNFKIKNEEILKYYLNILLSNKLSATSPIYQKYKKKGIVLQFIHEIHIINDHVILIIKAICKSSDVFLKNIKRDLKDFNISQNDFERKKKGRLKNILISFENIEDVDSVIAYEKAKFGKINYNIYDDIKNLSYSEIVRISKIIDLSNKSIIRVNK